MLFNHIPIDVVENIVNIADVHVNTTSGELDDVLVGGPVQAPGELSALGGLSGFAPLHRQIFCICICIKTTLGLTRCIQLKHVLVVSLASQVENQLHLDIAEANLLDSQPFEFLTLIFVENIELVNTAEISGFQGL